MKRLFAALLAVPSLVFAAATESATVVWKDSPPEHRNLAIRAFMDVVAREELVVYSTTPGKLSGICSRSLVPELRQKAREQAEKAARPAAAKKEPPARKDAPRDERVFEFSLSELLDPDREIWLVHRLVAVGGRREGDLENGAAAVVFFGGTEKQGSLVVGQVLRGVLEQNGVHTVTNSFRREAFGEDGWERRRTVERMRRYVWKADRSVAPEEESAAPAAGEEEPPPGFYFRTFGINYLNAEHVFPLWLRARGGSFQVSEKGRRACDRCGGKGKWTEWKGGGQQIVSCAGCGGTGSVEVRTVYTFVLGPSAPRRNLAFP